MENKDYFVALIAEGSAENAILELLLDNNALKFRWEDVFEEEIIRTRSGKNFARTHLNKDIPKKIKVYRILDSTKENFKVPVVYQKKLIKPVINIYTRPEIEILLIIYHGDYNHYYNQRKYKKPSLYAKTNYKHDMKKIKGYQDVYDFWKNHFSDLIKSILKYKQLHNKKNNEKTLADLLGPEIKEKYENP